MKSFMDKPSEYKNLLDIFIQLREAIKKEDVLKIKELSNRTIHSASINQDTDSIAIAVIIYAISKIIERKKYRNYPGWLKFYNKLNKAIDKCLESIKSKNFDEFRKSLFEIRNSIKLLKGHLKDYIEQVFRKAKINKGSRIYEHGISFAQTAQIIGITLYELAEYIGQTGISNVELSITKNIEDRIKIIEELFG